MRWKQEHQSPFLLKEQPSVSLARPPVGWHNTVWQLPHTTTVCEWLNTVVMLKHPWHLTSMKKELGVCTSLLSLCFLFSSSAGGWSKSISFWSTILIDADCRKPENTELQEPLERAGVRERNDWEDFRFYKAMNINECLSDVGRRIQQ